MTRNKLQFDFEIDVYNLINEQFTEYGELNIENDGKEVMSLMEAECVEINGKKVLSVSFLHFGENTIRKKEYSEIHSNYFVSNEGKLYCETYFSKIAV